MIIVAVVPLMQDVLALAERAASGKAGPVEAERALLRARFDATAARCRGPLAADWELAGYALAAVADELMIVDIAWPGQSWWENHALEVELFGTRRRATEFYARAEKAAAIASQNVLQIYVAAVLMGFRGILRDRPDALDTWLRSNGQLVKLSIDRPAVPAVGPDVPGAPPLAGRSELMWAVLVSALAAAALIVTAWGAFLL
ncbi:MAG: DotU family type IV/VI secretion system protein [Planctomycetaceae bacterium]|nr:DotU family type IV/VI secretion system protein [Planctomycetaceae bacterium]